jgi:hypothetical protein
MLFDTGRSSTVDKSLSRQEVERLERQIDRMLADVTLNPSRNTPLLNRKIEQLDAQIDTLRLNAIHNQSVGRPPFSEHSKAVRPHSNSRAIERLEEQISIMLFNAAQSGKPLSNREIERLDAQMDMLLAAEAQDSSGYRPFSKGQIECYPAEIEDGPCTSDQIKASSGLTPALGDEIHGKGSDTPYPDTEYYLDSEGESIRQQRGVLQKGKPSK